jgi:hypothetical protein
MAMCYKSERNWNWTVATRIFGSLLIVFGGLTLVSCRDSRHMSQASFDFDLSPSQAARFKTDLRKFALVNDYAFIDASREMKESREYINTESERSGKQSPGLAIDGEIVDVTVEPKDSWIDSLIIVQTSADDSKKISLTVIYDRNSVAERSMTENFLHSQFLRDWEQYGMPREQRWRPVRFPPSTDIPLATHWGQSAFQPLRSLEDADVSRGMSSVWLSVRQSNGSTSQSEKGYLFE